MSSYRRYRCPECSLEVKLGGPEEFYRAPDGRIEPYGHPEPISEDAARRGVDGFRMHLWCPSCRSVEPVVTLEFRSPCDPLDAWAGRAEPLPGYPADAESCPRCGATLEDELQPGATLCPGCARAPLRSA